MITTFALTGPHGLTAAPVFVDVAIGPDYPPHFKIKGLTDVQVKEHATRVRSALYAGNIEIPHAIEFGVGGIPARGRAPGLDLALVFAVPGAASGFDLDGLMVAGEVGFDGSVRAIRGVTQMVTLAKSRGMRGALVPAANASEALAVAGPDPEFPVYTINHLTSTPARVTDARAPRRSVAAHDFADVRGQETAVAAIETAVRERNGLCLSGPPGVGKTMIARRVPSIMPELTQSERLAITAAYSAIGLVDGGLVVDRPFRAPHHTISATALAGGNGRPGELHLAAHGVLFLDEIHEFSRLAIDAIATALDQMPAAERPLVIAATMPCACGWRGSIERACQCSNSSVAAFQARGTRHPIASAYALQKLGITATVAVQPLAVRDMQGEPGESSAAIRARLATVLVETMPEHLRASHRAARNFGTYPHNGAKRERMNPADAAAIVAADPDGYARIIEGA